MTTDRNSGPDSVPGATDRSMPERIWLQIDTSGNNEDRDEPLPEDHYEHVSWCWEQIGGLEVEYVRADLAPSAAEVQALVERMERALIYGDPDARPVTEHWRDELAKLIPRGK